MARSQNKTLSKLSKSYAVGAGLASASPEKSRSQVPAELRNSISKFDENIQTQNTSLNHDFSTSTFRAGLNTRNSAREPVVNPENRALIMKRHEEVIKSRLQLATKQINQMNEARKERNQRYIKNIEHQMSIVQEEE